MDLFKKINNFLQSEAFATAGIYTFTNFFVKGVSFILLFIYSNPHFITVEENGLLSLLSSSILFLTPFIYLGALQSVSIDFYKLDKDAFRNYFTTSFVLPIVITVASILLFYLFEREFVKNFNFQKSFIWLVPLIVFMGFCSEQFFTLIRNRNEPKRYLGVGIFRIFIEASISICLVVLFSWHWKGRVAGIFISQFVVCFLGYLYFKKRGYLFGAIKKSYLKQELFFALPIIFMQLSIFSMLASDKFFLAKYVNNHAVGIYGYACIFASVLNVFSAALMQYLIPKIYSYLSEKEVNYKAIRKHFIIFLSVCFCMLIGIVLFTPVVYKYFINVSYHDGLKYLYLIVVGYFFWGIAYFFYSFLLFYKQKLKILLLATSGILLSLVFNKIFILKYGEWGAAFSIFLSYFIFLGVTMIFTFKYLRKIFTPIKSN